MNEYTERCGCGAELTLSGVQAFDTVTYVLREFRANHRCEFDRPPLFDAGEFLRAVGTCTCTVPDPVPLLWGVKWCRACGWFIPEDAP